MDVIYSIKSAMCWILSSHPRSLVLEVTSQESIANLPLKVLLWHLRWVQAPCINTGKVWGWRSFVVSLPPRLLNHPALVIFLLIIFLLIIFLLIIFLLIIIIIIIIITLRWRTRRLSRFPWWSSGLLTWKVPDVSGLTCRPCSWSGPWSPPSPWRPWSSFLSASVIGQLFHHLFQLRDLTLQGSNFFYGRSSWWSNLGRIGGQVYHWCHSLCQRSRGIWHPFNDLLHPIANGLRRSYHSIICLIVEPSTLVAPSPTMHRHPPTSPFVTFVSLAVYRDELDAQLLPDSC